MTIGDSSLVMFDGDSGRDIRSSDEILEASEGPFEAPDDTFVQAVREEIARARENPGGDGVAIPADAVFFRELEEIEEALVEGDVEGAQASIDELTGDLDASLGTPSGRDVAPFLEVADAFDDLIASGFLSPDDARILYARDFFIDSLNGDVEFFYATTEPPFSGEALDDFELGLFNLHLGLQDRIRTASEEIEVSESRVGFDVRETAIYDDVRVLAQGYGDSILTLPDEFERRGPIEPGRGRTGARRSRSDRSRSGVRRHPAGGASCRRSGPTRSAPKTGSCRRSAPCSGTGRVSSRARTSARSTF